MKRLVAAVIALSMLGGCGFKGGAPYFPLSSKRMKMYDANQALERGDEPAAVRLMEEVSREVEIDEGVTDEALFRLSLLGMRQYRDPDSMKLLRGRLDRLNTEYPSSIWTRLSWPLMEYVSEAEKARSEMRNAKARKETSQQIQSLVKENRELQQRIEKLKSLDLELERKNRR